MKFKIYYIYFYLKTKLRHIIDIAKIFIAIFVKLFKKQKLDIRINKIKIFYIPILSIYSKIIFLYK